MREREFIELPMRCELAVHVEQGGAAITCFSGLWFPAERGEDGINLGYRVRRQERQIFGVEGVEWRAHPTIGQPGLLVGSLGEHKLPALGGDIAYPPAPHISRTRRSQIRPPP